MRQAFNFVDMSAKHGFELRPFLGAGAGERRRGFAERRDHRIFECLAHFVAFLGDIGNFKNTS